MEQCIGSVRYNHREDDDQFRASRLIRKTRSVSELPRHHIHQLPNKYFITAPQDAMSGFYLVTISNIAHFEGLFKCSRRFGPGVLTYLDSMCQDVGWWCGGQLIRLCRLVNIVWVPSLKYPRTLDNGNVSTSYSIEVRNIILPPETSVRNYKLCSLRKSRTRLTDVHVNLEEMLGRAGTNLFFKKGHVRKFADKYLAIYGNFNIHANNETMSRILDYTFMNFDEETSHKVMRYANSRPGEFSKCGLYESACIDFLLCCSSGNENYIKWLNTTYNINPNLCDANGNAGIIYAAARDKLGIVIYLASLHANMNIANDEGLSALSIVLLRFIGQLRNVQSWHTAFINTMDLEYAEEKFVDSDSMLLYSEVNFYYNHRSLEKLADFNLEDVSVEKLFAFYGLNIPVPTLQTFQKPYISPNNVKEKHEDKYVFDFRLKHENPKRVREVRGRRITYSTFLRLTVIFNTLVVLLHHGCDPCSGSVPLPPLFLALFTESSDVVRILLKFGADPMVRLPKYDNITVLHALVSMRPGKYMLSICNTLLAADFDLDARTDSNHWLEERRWIIGNFKGSLDCGKTALHILALRDDFHSDRMWMRQVAQQLILKGANYSKRYLGHVPLTLAMLRGNVELARTLLKCGASPNESLGNKMGSPLTVYLLNRYKGQLPSIEICKSVMQLLFEHNGDPLMKVYTSSNTLEFIRSEKYLYIGLTKRRRPVKRMHKLMKQTKLQLRLKTLLVLQARQRLMRHYQGLIFVALFLAVRAGARDLQDSKFYVNLVRLLRVKECLQIVRYLIYFNIYQPGVETDFNAVHYLVSFIRSYGIPAKAKGNILNQLTGLKPLQYQLELPDLDCKFQKYKVCFTCCLCTGKILLPCPNCGVIYFCSSRCEFYSKRHKLHPCKILFYEEELKQYRFCISHNIQYEGVHDEYFNGVRQIIASFQDHVDCDNMQL